MNPLMHVPNIAGHFAVEKGGIGTGTLSLLGKTGRETLGKAIDAVAHQNEDYITALEHGAPLQSHRQGLWDMQKLIFESMGREIEKAGPTLSKALGYANPVHLVKAWYRLSGKITWVTNDVAFMQSVYQKQAGGMSLDDAISETAKHIPDYRIPTHVADSKFISAVMRKPLVMQFMAYHYGAMKSYGEAIKSAMGLNNRPAGGDAAADKRHGWDILASIGIAYLGYKALNQFLKMAVKDKRAHLRAPGPLTIPENIAEVAAGQKDPSQALESTLTPAVLPKKALELYFNRDMYTGRRIYDPSGGVVNTAFQVLRHGASAISPVDQGLRSFEVKSRHNPLWQMAGVSFPKPHRHERAITKDWNWYRKHLKP
jgi:hypothetical protein